MNNTDSKPCKICHLEKPLTEFSKDSQLKSGISNRCKACDKEKNSKRYKGFSWKDVKDACPTTPESELAGLYGTSDVRVKGKLVMRKGQVLDEAWYQRKLDKLRKGRRKKGEKNG